jgi:hypothetical protein
MLLEFLMMVSLSAHAIDPGKFTFVGIAEPAPFEGVLFDPTATAELLSQAAVEEQKCNERVTYELNKQDIEHTLKMENCEIRYDSLKEEFKLITAQKDVEIDQLRDSLKSISPSNRSAWYGAGIVTGVIGTVVAVKYLEK